MTYYNTTTKGNTRSKKLFNVSCSLLTFFILHFSFFSLSCEKKAVKAEVNEPQRIISTAPSNTEIIAGLGLADSLIATDPYSTDIAGVPQGLTHIDFFYPDVEAILLLAPDIVITNEHNSTGTGSDPFKLLRETGVQVIYIPTSTSIEGIYGDIRLVAGALQRIEEGEKLITKMKTQVDEIAAAGKNRATKKTIYFELSPAPSCYSFGTGTYLNEMITIIGAQNIFADQSGWIAPSVESIVVRNPDVILTNVSYTQTPIEDIKNSPGFSQTTAVKNNAVYQIDANASSRPSQNIVIALRQMSEMVYP
jgi:iron complex transport system substrate-binding protein